MHKYPGRQSNKILIELPKKSKLKQSNIVRLIRSKSTLCRSFDTFIEEDDTSKLNF